MAELTALTLAQARGGLQRREFSARELVEAHLQQMEAARVLNAYVLETPDQARAMAAATNARLSSGVPRRREEIPLALKNIFATKDGRTTTCSKIRNTSV